MVFLNFSRVSESLYYYNNIQLIVIICNAFSEGFRRILTSGPPDGYLYIILIMSFSCDVRITRVCVCKCLYISYIISVCVCALAVGARSAAATHRARGANSG